MKKQELIEELNNGWLPVEFYPSYIGQGYGYKADVVIDDVDENEVIYIPEYGYDDNCPEIDCIYTKKDLLEICKGDKGLLEFMWETLDWQSPETLYDEWESNGIIGE